MGTSAWDWSRVATLDDAQRYVSILQHGQDQYREVTYDWVFSRLQRRELGYRFYVGGNRVTEALACFAVRHLRRYANEPTIVQMGSSGGQFARVASLVHEHMAEVVRDLEKATGQRITHYRIAGIPEDRGRVLSAQVSALAGVSEEAGSGPQRRRYRFEVARCGYGE